MFKNVIVAVLLAASSVVAHSNMFEPTPRKNQDSEYTSSDQNACAFGGTDIPSENNFQRGQKVPVKCECLYPLVFLASGADTFWLL
jgi:hypothetical protein